MKALVLGQSADSRCANLSLKADYPRPVPGEGEALVRVRMTGICNTDLELMRGYMGFSGIPGHEFTGEVMEVISGDKDSSLVGKRVVGEINAACGSCSYCQEGVPTHCDNRTVLGILGRQGSMAEYLTLPIENLHVIPEGVSDEEAVFVEPLAAAYEILEQVEVNSSDRVVVLGDGKLGLLCAMALLTTGADVTLVGRHERKMALVKPYGVNTALSGGEGVRDTFDVVVEATGSADGFTQAMAMTRPLGVIVLKSTVAEGKPLNLAPIVINEITVVGSRCGPFAPAIDALASGRIDPTPLIEATYPIDDALKAFEHASQKGALKVLIQV